MFTNSTSGISQIWFKSLSYLPKLKINNIRLNTLKSHFKKNINSNVFTLLMS